MRKNVHSASAKPTKTKPSGGGRKPFGKPMDKKTKRMAEEALLSKLEKSVEEVVRLGILGSDPGG